MASRRSPSDAGLSTGRRWKSGFGKAEHIGIHRPLLHRARIVDRFLDHLVEQGLITSNPIAVLRSEYSVKQSRPIWQALASRNAGSGACRAAPAQAVRQRPGRDHARACRADAQRGYRYTTQAAWFLRFDRFLQAHPELAKRTGHDDAGALGGSQDDAPSRRGMRKAEAGSHQGPSPSGPERAGEATGRTAAERSGATLSEAAHL